MVANAQFSEIFNAAPLMAIVRGMGVERSLTVATTAWDLGIDVVELPIQTPEDIEALRVVARAGRERGKVVGAGAVVSVEHVRQAAGAGAEFTVCPGFDLEVVAASSDAGMPAMPGVATASEVQLALKEGLTRLKAFPASVLGTAWIKAMHGPFPQARFVTTGGMNAANAGEFLRAGARVVAIGSALQDPSQAAQACGAARAGWAVAVFSNSNLLAFVDAKLAYEIDVVAASLAQTDGTAIIVDTRKQLSWDHGHVAGALHLPACPATAPSSSTAGAPAATVPHTPRAACSPRASTCAS
jgi:Entner-Doudoroff aldolase